VNVILFYYDDISKNIPIIYIHNPIYQHTNLLSFNKNYQNLIISKLFYFILYLALEIGYFFVLFVLQIEAPRKVKYESEKQF
jgi:hypothetical protein